MRGIVLHIEISYLTLHFADDILDLLPMIHFRSAINSIRNVQDGEAKFATLDRSFCLVQFAFVLRASQFVLAADIHVP